MSIPFEKSLEQIREDLFVKINEVQKDYATKGWLPDQLNLNKGIARGMVEIWAWGLFQLYQFLSTVLKQIFIDSASGSWLDLLCRIADIERKKMTKAQGIIVFTREESQGNVPVPSGRIVKTLPDGAGNVYRFVTIEEVVIKDGETSVAVPVVAEEYGSGANVTADQITEIVTVIPGIDDVRNDVDWLTAEGADTEDDTGLKARYVLKWRGNNGCTKYAYEGWARSVAGVVAARIMDQHPRGQGTVDVVIQGTAGVPTADLIAAVDKVIQKNVPVNDDAKVLGVTPVNISLSGNLVLIAGTYPEGVIKSVTDKVRALFSINSKDEGIAPFAIGEDVILDRVVAQIMTVSGIKQVVWGDGIGNTVVPEAGLAILDELNFSTSFAESE